MGKQKRQRHKPHKENPTGLPSVKEFELSEEITEGAKEKVLQNAYGDVSTCSFMNVMYIVIQQRIKLI